MIFFQLLVEKIKVKGLQSRKDDLKNEDCGTQFQFLYIVYIKNST